MGDTGISVGGRSKESFRRREYRRFEERKKKGVSEFERGGNYDHPAAGSILTLDDAKVLCVEVHTDAMEPQTKHREVEGECQETHVELQGAQHTCLRGQSLRITEVVGFK